jgi:heme-degrading monooxygenase HmoA
MTVWPEYHGGQAAGRKTDSPQVTTTAAGQLRPVARASPVQNTRKRSVSMFTRTVEVTFKSGKARELANIIKDKALPILKKQKGFVDEAVLVSDTEENRVLSLSFWNSKDAERYQREQYPAIHEMVRHLLEAEPVIRTFNVDSSTTHRIAAGKAA